MSDLLSDEHNRIIESVAQSKGFQNYKIDVQAGSLKGDGYLGIIKTVKIRDENQELNLVIKSALSGEQLRQHAPVRKAYEREIYMYTTVFPKFRNFSQERNIRNEFTEIAKCYASLLKENEECLVLENLKEIGFRLWNRKIPMNSDHVGLVFKTYGKFHATGLALKHFKPEKYGELSKNLVNIFEDGTEEGKEKFKESAKVIFENGFKAVANSEKATQALTRFAQGFSEYILKEGVEVNKYCTILHGDCWCNNMMYKYEDPENPTKPTQVCFLDWQIARIGSPVFDISYFFCACSSKEVLYDIDKYLKIYYESLTKTLEESGLDPEKIFTFEELKCQWKIHVKFGLFMTLFVTRVILSEVDEVPDLSELAESGKDILQCISSSNASNNEEIFKRITDVVLFMDDLGYI